MTSTPDPMPTGLGATPDPLAACVAALQSARCERYYDDDGCDGPDGCDACQRLMVAEVAPLLLEAVVAELERNDERWEVGRESYTGWHGMQRAKDGEWLDIAEVRAALARLLATPVGPATTQDGR